MIALVDRALVLNPSFARGWYLSGGLRIWAGEIEAGIEHIEASLRLSPRARVGYANGMISLPIFIAAASPKHCQNCSSRFRKMRRPYRIAVLRSAMPLWGALTKRGKSSLGCESSTPPLR